MIAARPDVSVWSGLPSMIDTLALLLFPGLMALAASSDLVTMRISNMLVLVVVIAFCVVSWAVGLPFQSFSLHVAAGLAVLGVAFTFFAFGWIGGGDAKLAAATTLWMGFGLALPFLVYAALFGGAITLLLLLLRRFPLPKRLAAVTWIDRLHDHRNGVPYGIALAFAGLVTYSDTYIFQQLVHSTPTLM
jgi:prepilin peptidase CpaA